ncbi:MAG: methyltransferase [Acidobacteria bacterium]|nr:methyltransferase [Acidobacteriota bacterium]
MSSPQRSDTSLDAAPAQMPSVPPQLALARMMTGYAVGQLIYVAARLGLADLLKDGAQSVDELARRTETDRDALYRVMRGLVAVGVLTEKEDAGFELTAIGQCLCKGAPGSMSEMALCSDESYFVWGHLLHTVQTGETAFNHLYDMDRYQYLRQHPEAAAKFHAAMSGLSAQVAQAVLMLYDLSGFELVIDVGGGSGTLLMTLLRAHPKLRGILFDQPAVVEEAGEEFTKEPIAGRGEVVAGDFLASVPAGGDAYLLSHVLHNWDDENCLRILRNCRAAMKQQSKLLVIEIVLPARLSQSPMTYPLVMTDLQMLVMTGGRERTEPEFRALLREAGFELRRVIQTRGLDSLIECVPV